MDFLHDLFQFEPWSGIQSCWILNLILLCFSLSGLRWKKEVSRSKKNIECSILGLWICPSWASPAPHELLKDAPQRVAFKFNASLQEKTKIVPHILSHPTQIYEDMLCISREMHQRDQGDESWDVPPIATKAPSKPVELVWAMIEHHPCPLDRSEWTLDRNL